MSIARLNKVTFVGLTEDRERLLQDLQNLGCLHIEPLTPESETPATAVGPSGGAREALQFLREYPHRRRQSRDISRFDALEVERKTLDVRQRLLALTDERDFLIKRIQDMRPWGDFAFSPLQEMGNLRFWFYVVPHRDMPRVAELGLPYEIIKKDNRNNYVVVISESEPEGMPVNRTHTGYQPRHVLEALLEDVELAIEDVQAERAYLTRWYTLLKDNIATLEDQAALTAALNQTYTRHEMFGLLGWAPQDRLPQLTDYARRHRVHIDTREAEPEENPPTYLENPSWLSAGENLVNFYMTPGYRTWDPSPVVFISFALFFAMILADAGYALLLGILLLFFWRKMGASRAGRRFRPLCLTIVVLSLLYGMLIGSYFGIAPPGGTPLAALHVLDMSNTNLMMAISVFIGCIHVILGASMDAMRHKNPIEGLESVGWACVVTAGLVFLISTAYAPDVLKPLSVLLAGAGALLVLLFAAPYDKPLSRLLKGLLGLTKVTGAFGDVLSYLRLFALGLASGALALEFNRMTTSIYDAMPGVGIVFGFLVLLLGHTVNLVLGLASAVIHGLRLNVIEFFNWGLKEEGWQFKPFRRNER